MAFSHTFDTATPAGSDDPAEADDRMQEIKAALQERLNVEHVFDLTGTEVSHANSGKHTAITTTSIVNAGALTNTGNLTLNTDKFTVDAATGNVVVAGTLGVTGVATVAKGSLLASSDAPTTDAMIVNKKYVDDQIAAAIAAALPDDDAFGAWANRSANTVYEAASDGFVLVNGANTCDNLYIKTDSVDPPTITRMADAGADGPVGLCCPVRKGDFWKVTYVGTAPTVYWLPVGG